MLRFVLVDEYVGTQLGVSASEAPVGETVVVESPMRLRPLPSYGFVHALWWYWLENGRSLVSVPPGAGEAVARQVCGLSSSEELADPELVQRLRAPLDEALRAHGLPPTDRFIRALVFACDASLLRRHHHGDCRRLSDESIPAAEGLSLPQHCFPDGVVYGVVQDARVVSVAYAHRIGPLEARLADPAIETAPAYRRRGYAQTALSAVVHDYVRRGGEAKYDCSPDNLASAATARSVGFVPYGRTLVLAAADEFA